MPRPPLVAKVTAALAVLLLVPFVVTVAGLRSERRAGAAGEAVALPPDPYDLITALQSERSASAVAVLGAWAATDPPATLDGSRIQVDDALAAFRVALDRADGAVLAAYEPAMGDLAGLGDLRASVDQNLPSPGTGDAGSPPDVAGAGRVAERYTDLVEALLDAADTVVATTAPPVAQEGVALTAVATAQVERTAELVRHLLLAEVDDGLNTPEEITAVSGIHAAWTAGNATLREAPAPYDAVVAGRFPDELVVRLDGAVDLALTGQTVPLDELTTLGQPTGPTGFPSLRAAIQDQLSVVVDEAEAGDDDRTGLLLVLTTLEAAAILALAVVAAATWSGRRPAVPPPASADPLA